jgi:NADH-quinone oxidoreductase subunit A
MDGGLLPIMLFVGVSAALAVGMLVAGSLIGPRRQSAVKQMPYESGMDPVHDAHRKFDVRFNLVAIAFLVFDVELLFLYPWAVASRDAAGIDQAIASAVSSGIARVRSCLAKCGCSSVCWRRACLCLAAGFQWR